LGKALGGAIGGYDRRSPQPVIPIWLRQTQHAPIFFSEPLPPLLASWRGSRPLELVEQGDDRRRQAVRKRGKHSWREGRTHTH